MNLERFIAARISNQGFNSFSSIILKIAVTAVALSLTVMILTTSVISGFKNQISSKVFDFWGHIHITDGNVGNSFELIPMEVDSMLLNELAQIDKTSYARPPTIFEPDVHPPVKHSKGGVEAIYPFTIVPAILSNKQDFEGVFLKGLDHRSDVSRFEGFIKSGEMIPLNDDEPTRSILVSEQTATRMNFSLNDRIIIHFVLDEDPIKRVFEIGGIYRTGLEEYDERFAMVDMRVLQQILEWNQDMVSGLEVVLEHKDDSDLLSDYIYFERLPGNLYSIPIQRKFSEIFQWLELQNINERVILILMTLVAIINMITAMLIFVLERTHMIGVLKALGSRNWTIRRIFLLNAASVILKGLLFGNAIALGLGFIQQKTGLLTLNEKDYYLDTVPVEFNIQTIVLINVATIVITLIFLILPTSLVTRIQPVKALKFN